jgi:3-oxoacyl-(acyl-carrier-protein) synthase
MQYALLAAREALSDAGWSEPAAQLSPEQRMGVAIGSGMSSCGEVIEAWHLLVGL